MSAKNQEMNELKVPLTIDKTTKKQGVVIKYQPVSYLKLYRFASLSDKFWLLLAIVLSAIAGIFNAVCSYQVGYVTGTIVDYLYDKNNTESALEANPLEKLTNKLTEFLTVSMIGGVLILFCTFLTSAIFGYTALRQIHIIKKRFLSNLLNQDIPWFDVNQTGDFASRMTEDMNRIEDGIGYKVSLLLFIIFSLITNVLLALVMNWKLCLICLVLFPIQTVFVGIIGWISSKLTQEELDAYADAGAVAEEALRAIRTVFAFEGQRKEQERYYRSLQIASSNNIKRAFFNGVSNGMSWFMGYSIIGITLWLGIKFIRNDHDLPEDIREFDTSKLITIIFSMINGLWFFLMLAPPIIQTLSSAKAGASKIFAVIDSKCCINKAKMKGTSLSGLRGTIEFKDVYFSYPSRKELHVLRGLSFQVNAGETVALVGASGCGKSTCVQLIQRFYDTDSGSVFIDNKDVDEFNLVWLRSCIGVVEQEPILFEGTLMENIRLGCKNASDSDIVVAARKANAHQFIKLLPEGYETMIGERGIQLSGGQKQRIAIARAFVRKPSILLLDEATSSLDVKSEFLVQNAVDQVSRGCTTVIIAHRLSTIRNADKIIVISNGKVKEEGNHQTLMEMKGEYYKLVISQITSSEGDLVNEQEEVKNHNEISFKSQIKQQPVLTSNLPTYSLFKLLKFDLPQFGLTLLGSVNAIINAASFCLISVLYGKFVGVSKCFDLGIKKLFSSKILQSRDLDYVVSYSDTYVLYFIYVSVVSAVATVLQFYTLGVSGERLILRIRNRMFKSVLAQSVGWFDRKENSVGALSVSLSSDAAMVQQVISQCFGYFLYMLAAFILAIAISVYFQWKVTLATLALYPVLFFGIVLEQKIISDDSDKLHTTLQETTKIAVEAISSIRTVASLNCENDCMQKFLNKLIYHENQIKKNIVFRGLVQGIACNLIVFCYCVGLYYGGILILSQQVDFVHVFIATDLLAITSWSLAHSATFLIDFEKGYKAAQRIMRLINKIPEIEIGKDADVVSSDITYDNVYFTYPERPSIPVLNGLDLSVVQGKVIALVGSSGCGKSTVIQLLQRFYDPDQGRVVMGQDDLKNLSLTNLRFNLGIVSQEPNLFSKTIRENIAYGDNTRDVSDEEIVDAATKANIHDFITGLPLNYETKLGERGMQLSGGQKQRIAIARALIRNPKILLLDEATSSLDVESEKIVQKTLDDAKTGRTCIIIAHRLSTVVDADFICVIDNGRVVEVGTHKQLLELKGIYFHLYKLH